MTKKENSESKNNVKFEDALQRLEKIVERLEGGDVPLEESLALYEEGISLFRHCSSKLEEAKKKVEVLTRKGSSGELQPEPLTRSKLGLAEEAGEEEESDKEELPF